MADQIEPCVFIPLGGMNQDDGYFNPAPDAEGRSAFEQGDFRYAQNVRTGISNSDNIGDAEILVSSLKVTTYKVWNGASWVGGSIPTGDNFPVGKHEDKQLRKVFFIRYNSNNQHTICEYRIQERAVYELLCWDGLKLAAKGYVSMTRIGNYLIFTDNKNKPRIIDFTNIYSLKSTLGLKFCEFHISFSKWAPVAPPTLRGFVIGDGVPELAKGLFQFSYRYVYIGGFRSRWSPLSQCVSSLYGTVAMNSIRVSHPGLIYDSVDINNPRNHQDEEFYRVVDYIELAFRLSSIDVWRIFKTVKPTNPSDLMQTSFTNRTVGTPVSSDDFYQDYDEVPLRSAAVEVIDNRVMFGNNLEEHEFIDDVDFIENVETYSAGITLNSWLNTVPKTLFSGFGGLSTSDDALLTDMNKIRQHAYKSRGIYKHAVEFRDETGKKSLCYTTDAWINYIPESDPDGVTMEKIFACGFNFKSSFKPPIWATNYQILRTNCLNIDYFIFGTVNEFKLLADDTTPTDDQVTNPEAARTMVNDFFNAGEAATQLSLYARYVAQTRKTKVITDINKASRIYIDINNWYNAAKNTGSDNDWPLNKLFYEYLQGDYVRFYGSSVTNPTDDQIKIYDVPIIEFTGRGVIIEKPFGLAWIPDMTDSAGSKFVVEIYRPKKQLKSSDLIYYEMGEWYPVINPGTDSRDFLKRDWRWTSRLGVTATTYKGHYAFHKLPLFSGDVHRFGRTYYSNYRSGTYPGDFTVNTASMNPDRDLVYDRWERNNGRPNTAYVTKPLVVSKETQIRFGGKYFQDAVYNNINNFVPRDQYLYPQEYGSIIEIMNVTSYQVESVGSILFALFSNKTVSIYVNRTTLEDLSGRTQILLSDRVLGSYNSSLGSNGCINPESITASNNGNVYWWDQFSASWVRYGRDGNTEISDYKMRSWFKEIGEILDPLYLPDSRPWVTSEFDNWMGELLTYISHSSLPTTFRGYADYKGVVFNEKINQWKYVHNYDADMYGKVNNEIIGFKGNEIFIHEAGEDYGSLYDVKYPCRIEPVFNIKANANKIWQNITEVASHKWSIERTLSEYLGIRIEQESSLHIDKLISKEYTYHSELLGDKNTPNSTDQNLARVTGNRLRSKIIRVLLRLDDQVDKKSLLHMVILGFSDSHKNL